MSAGILSRTVKSVNKFGPHLKSQALNAMSRLSRLQEQLLIVRCHGKAMQPRLPGHGRVCYRSGGGGEYRGFPEEIGLQIKFY